jgi:hypothetical protein
MSSKMKEKNSKELLEKKEKSSVVEKIKCEECNKLHTSKNITINIQGDGAYKMYVMDSEKLSSLEKEIQQMRTKILDMRAEMTDIKLTLASILSILRSSEDISS